MNKKILLIIGIVLIVLFGILLRIYLSEGIVNNEPSNPDGLYFQRLAETNIQEDNLRYNHSQIHKEVWYKFFPTNLYLFGIINFLLILILGLVFLNLERINYLGSILYSILISFSTIILTRLNIGFYDHDVIGMICFFIIIIFLYLYEIKNNFLFLVPVPLLVFSLKYLWGGLFYITLLFLGIYFSFKIEKKFLDKIWTKIVLSIPFIIFAISKMGNNLNFVSENNTSFYYLFLFIFFSIPVIVGLMRKENKVLINSLFLFSLIFSFFSLRTLIISFPIIFLIICDKIKDFKEKELKSIFSILIIFLLIVSFAFMPFNSIKTKSYSNQEWNEATNWLKENTPEDSLILSWWDYGYYIQKNANRKTLMDGGSYPQAKEISLFFCNGNYSIIEKYNIEYLILFSREFKIRNSILKFGGNECFIEIPYIDLLLEGKNHQMENIVFYNNKTIIYGITPSSNSPSASANAENLNQKQNTNMKINTYNQKKLIGRQKFNALMLKAF